LEAVEAIFLLSLWRASGFGHSVTLTMEEEDFIRILRSFGLEPVDGKSIAFTGYMREVSALIPFLALREDYSLADSERNISWTIILAILLTFAL
jgi:hypothetical protein